MVLSGNDGQRQTVKTRQIDRYTEHTLLGPFINRDLTWNSHVHFITKKRTQKMYQLANIHHFLEDRDVLYMTYT